MVLRVPEVCNLDRNQLCHYDFNNEGYSIEWELEEWFVLLQEEHYWLEYRKAEQIREEAEGVQIGHCSIEEWFAEHEL